MRNTTVMLILACSIAASSQLYAKGKPYGMAGCGLGSLVFKPSSSGTSAATTNGTGGQTFAITSGTSNCLPKEKWAVEVQQKDFIVTNYSTLSKEIAQGDGLTLSAFASQLGCDQSLYPEFSQYLQGQYDRLMLAPGALAMLDATKTSLGEHKALSKGCQNI